MDELDEFLAKAAKAICPRCDQPIQQERQIGRCVYAVPCGCRLWQGMARSRAELDAIRMEAK